MGAITKGSFNDVQHGKPELNEDWKQRGTFQSPPLSSGDVYRLEAYIKGTYPNDRQDAHDVIAIRHSAEASLIQDRSIRPGGTFVGVGATPVGVGVAAVAEAPSDRARVPASSALPADLVRDMCDLLVVPATMAERGSPRDDDAVRRPSVRAAASPGIRRASNPPL